MLQKAIFCIYPLDVVNDVNIYTYTTYLMKAKKVRSVRLTTQPAVAKALGMVRAPVPTIMLNMYTKPTYARIQLFISNKPK